MSSAFSKEVRRSITSSWGRFLAIAGIVALGCGFYAGLRMTGPDMRINADAFYDGTELYDLRVLSTQGLTDSTVDLISNTEGVDEVMPVKSTDVVATLNGEQYVVRTTSLDVEGAEESTAVNAYTVDSDDSSYLNRLVLDEGSWPTQEEVRPLRRPRHGYIHTDRRHGGGAVRCQRPRWHAGYTYLHGGGSCQLVGLCLIG